MEINCKMCNTDLDNPKMFGKGHVHHLIPKKWGGTDLDGRVWLCGEKTEKKCHVLLTKILDNRYNSRGYSKKNPPSENEKTEIKKFQLGFFK